MGKVDGMGVVLGEMRQTDEPATRMLAILEIRKSMTSSHLVLDVMNESV